VEVSVNVWVNTEQAKWEMDADRFEDYVSSLEAKREMDRD
jgi:hypothetical protein